MNTLNQNDFPENHTRRSSSAWMTGAILILIGAFSLVAQFVKLEWLQLLFLPMLGMIFLLWGILRRSGGLLIPGGILSGLGLGIILMNRLPGLSGGPAQGGILLLSFAAGWALITLFSAVFTDYTMWWPLIPGGILAFIGAALVIGGAWMQVLTLLGYGWPLILIAIGLYLVFWRNGLRE
jgi:hypothetical protein